MTLCHIAIASEWDEAQESGSYTRSTLNRSLAEIGFIHASDSYEQAARVVRYLFGDVPGPFALLDLSREALEQVGLRIVPESISPHDPASEKFPHIYGGPLPVTAVVQARRFGTAEELLAALDAG